MDFFNLKGVNQSGNSCRGLILYKGGQYYLVYKAEHKPDDPFLEPPLKDFRPNSSTGDQFVEGLDDGTIERLYSYVNDHPTCVSPTDMMDTIAVSLEMSSLLVSQIRVFNNPAVKKLQEVKSSVLVLSKQITDDDIPDLVQLIPVRYALDEFQLMLKKGDTEHSLVKNEGECKDKHNLPTSGNFNGGYFKKALSENSYTLRQLTDGWLYVWDEVGETMYEYEVKGSQFIRYIFGSKVAEKANEDRGEPTSPLPYIEFPKSSVLHLMFSQVRWSWRLLEEFRGNTKSGKKRREVVGARKVTCSTLTGSDTGLATEVLESVADIGDKDKALFPLATPSVKTRVAGDVSIIGQPIKSTASYLDKLAETETVRVVALDDIWSDINDMTSQIKYLESHLYETTLEGEMEWRATAQAVIDFCSGTVDDTLLPEHIRGNDVLVQEFNKDLTNYYSNKKNYISGKKNFELSHADEKDQLANIKFITGIFEAQEQFFMEKYLRLPNGEKYSSQLSKEKEEMFERKFFRDQTAYEKWASQSSLNANARRYADRNRAQKELAEHLQHDQFLIDLIEPRVNELYNSLFAIPVDGIVKFGLDTTIAFDQYLATQCFNNCFEVVLPHLDTKKMSLLKKEIFALNYSPVCILSVFLTGFELELRSVLNEQLETHQKLIDDEALIHKNEISNKIKETDKSTSEVKQSQFIKGSADVLLVTNDAMEAAGEAKKLINDWHSKLTSRGSLVHKALLSANKQWKSLGLSLLQGIAIQTGSSTDIFATKKLYLLNAMIDSKGLNQNSKFYKQMNRWLSKRQAITNNINKYKNLKLEVLENIKAYEAQMKSHWTEVSEAAPSKKELHEKIKAEGKRYRRFSLKVNAFQDKRMALLGFLPARYLPSKSDNNAAVQAATQKLITSKMDEASVRKIGKGLTVGFIILNIINTEYFLSCLPEELELSLTKDTDSVRATYAGISAVAYLGQALSLLMASSSSQLVDLVMDSKVFNPKNETYFNKIRLSVGVNTRGILQISTADAKEYFNNKKLTTLLQRTKIFYSVLGVFTIIATMTEFVPLWHDTFGGRSEKLNKLEKTLSVIKISTLAASTVSGIYSTLLGVGAIAGFAWAVPVFAVLGAVYIVSTIALDYFRRSDIEIWLDYSRYGDSSKGWSVDEEYQQLLFLLYAPNVFARPTFIEEEVINFNTPSIYKRVTGYYLLIKLPQLDCSVEVAQISDTMGYLPHQKVNEQLEDIDVIWLSSADYNTLLEQGLPNKKDAKFLENIENNSAKQHPQASLMGLLPLPLAKYSTSLAKFRLKIINPDKNMCWSFDIDLPASSLGKNIECGYSGKNTSWNKAINPIRILPSVSDIIEESDSTFFYDGLLA
ncbi:toxin VasX [Psychromonas sp. SP041]|uniref:toxin VasX n=1 Tax=Psychromonas sp. SP041 TaxID=1365007 RepID=UPI0010C78D2D|nr:toxin VasX [Psychromonas sp. SP041]